MTGLLADAPLHLPDNLSQNLPVWAFGFMLTLARVGAAMALLPGLGEAASPAMLRVGLALGITALLLPDVMPLIPHVPEASLQAAAMVLAEVVTGLWFGWLTRLLALALPVAAQIIAYLLGISSVLQPDAELGPQSTALAKLFELSAPLLMLVSGLYMLPLVALADLYRLIPPGTLLPAADSADSAARAVAWSFALSLRLASPFVVAGLVWQVTIGLIARLVPRMQIYFSAMPGQILGGFLLLAGMSGLILSAWQDSVRPVLAALPGGF
ncbi:MAG TPA: flagellar biosynthetic protein FliR [Acetobacteraceae bacterium]